jgi:protein-L-isoaspartate(D-aspartate) O-methyltransferase
MQPRGPDWCGPETPDAARARLVSALRHGGRALSHSVQEAFAQVPRHVFVPEVGPAAAYRDEAFVIKCGPDGLPVSSSSQPAMMAIMLDQLGLGPGHRVLEIGTGSGYNAAVMSVVVGRRGQVVTVDIDAELVARARSSLGAAGYDTVTVRCGDGGYGDPDGAPFDRIIVTAGAWDIAPAWLDQLGQGGRLVLPLSVRGIQLSVALERSGEEWRSASAWRCGFVKMLGAFAGPETVLRLDGPHALIAQMSDGSPVDEHALQLALAGPSADEQALRRPVNLADLADLDLWLTITSAELDRLTLLAAPGGWLPLTSLLPFGGLVSNATEAGRMGIAVLLPAELASGGTAGQPGRPGRAVTIRGFGPGGSALAAGLAGKAQAWADLGRPGARDMQLTVWPAGTGSAKVAAMPSGGGRVIMPRPNATLEVGWPGSRARAGSG